MISLMGMGLSQFSLHQDLDMEVWRWNVSSGNISKQNEKTPRGSFLLWFIPLKVSDAKSEIHSQTPECMKLNVIHEDKCESRY